jgi:hypothetical protein
MSEKRTKKAEETETDSEATREIEDLDVSLKLKIEDLSVEDSPDAQGENVKGGFEATGRITHITQI